VAQWIELPMRQPSGLRGPADIEVELEQLDTAADQRLFEARHRLKELFEILFRAETHDVFDTRPVVPAAIEDDDLASTRKLRSMPLEIPTGEFALGWLAERHHPRVPRAQVLNDVLDDVVLA
jgi:hypothetical protein